MTIKLISKLNFCTALIIQIAFLTASCSFHNPNSSSIHYSSTASITDSDLTVEQKSDALAKEAEDLLNANGIEEANKTSALALNENPKQLKAGFIKATTDLILVFKGIGVRLQPLFTENKKLSDEYQENLTSAIKSINNPSLQKILMDGEPNITTEEDFLKFLDQVVEKFEALRVFIKTNKDSELTIKAYPLFAKELSQRYAHACELVMTKDNSYDIKCPDNSTRFEVSLNRADFEELQYMTSMILISLSFYTSYDLSGSIEISRQKKIDSSLSPQKIYDQLLKNNNFGKLRSSSKLNIVSSLGIDAMTALQWHVDNQNLACPKGIASSKNRPGMLNNQGLCVGSYFGSWLADGISFFQGVPKNLTLKKEDGSDYTTKANYMTVMSNPIQDFRQLGQITFDSCGNISHVEDPTAAGMYPNQDANTVIPLLITRCNQK